MTVSTSYFLSKIRKNKRFRQSLKMLERGVFSVDWEADKKEVLAILKSRQTRTLSARDMLTNFQKHTIEISMQSTASRSRVVEINLQYFELSESLSEHIDNLKNYLATKYAKQLRVEFSTVKARSDALDSVVEDFSKLLTKCGIVMRLCKEVIEDIDASNWWVARMTAVMELQVKGSH